MKKIIALLLALAMLCFAGCGKGGNETPDNNDDTKAPVSADPTDNQGQENPNKETVSSSEITMEDLLHAPESSAEDFKVMTYGDGSVVLEGYLGDDEIMVIPESLGITRVAKYIFNNDAPIKAIRFSSTVKVIDMSAFTGNSNLQLVALGDGMQEIGLGAFQGCSNLREIKINDGLMKIDTNAFSSCDSLKEVTIPSSVTVIEPLAFFLLPSDFVIIGEAGSAAETYANSEGITFKAK